MPLDPSIILGVKPPAPVQIADPLDQFAKSLTVRQLLQQGDLGDLKAQEARQGLADDAAMRDAYKGDPAGVRARLQALGLYKGVQAYDKADLEKRKGEADITKDTATAGHTKAQTDILALQHGSSLLDGIKTLPPDQQPAAYQSTLAIMDRLSPGSSANILKAMPTYNVQTATQIAQAGLTHAEQLKAQNDALQTKETGRHNLEGERNARANTGIAGGQLSLARQRFDAEQSAPQYMQTDAGIVALPKKPGATGKISATPVVGPDGQPLTKPLQNIPAAVNTAIISNAQNINKAEAALKLLAGGKVGQAQGDKDATGIKGFAPQTALNYFDQSGVDTRAAIADLGSMVLHDRSGAAVTASESPRLLPFIPQATDSAETARKKLARFVDVFRQEQNALNATYSKDQGYKPSPVIASQQAAPAAPAAPVTATNPQTGQKIQLINGQWQPVQ